MQKSTISVIILVYNVESYLHKCLDSIRAQTFDSLEIILIDDGSKDESGNICDEYAKNDSRFTVYHQENQGVSAARNKGLDLASGDYIIFVDSDDWIEPDMLEVLYNNLINSGADVSACGSDRIPLEEGVSFEPTVFLREEALKAILQNSHISIYLWNKLCKKELYDGIRFPVGQTYEDVTKILDIIEGANKMVFTMSPKYHYTIRATGITGSAYKPSEEGRIIAANKNLEFAKQKYPSLIPFAKARLLLAHYKCLIKILSSPSKENKSKQTEHSRILRKNLPFILFSWPKDCQYRLPLSASFLLKVTSPGLFLALRGNKIKRQ